MERAPLSGGGRAPVDRWKWALLGLIALIYLPSLSGGWVWDDHFLLADPAVFASPWRLLTQDVFSATGNSAEDVYRPLALLSYAPGQWLWPGPTVVRIVSLLLHLVAVTAAGRIAAALAGEGRARAASLLGMALMGLHPVAVEAVAWPSGRYDLLGTTLLLLGCAWLLSVPRERALHGVAPGVLMGAAVFCKEPFLLAPVVPLLLSRSVHARPARAATVSATATVAGYLLVRRVLALPLGGGAVAAPLEAIGALSFRGLRVLVDPLAVSPFPQFHGSLPGAGVLLVAGLALLYGAWSSPAWGLVAAGGLLLLPAGLASSVTGLVADRYFYAAWGLTAPALAVGLMALQSAIPERSRRGLAIAGAGWLLLAGVSTSLHAFAWRSNRSLYQRAWERDPENPHAAFHLGYELHVEEGDCSAAVPLYRQGWAVDPRAGNNLQVCLLAVDRPAEAAALAEQLMDGDPRNPGPAWNSAIALARVDRLLDAQAAALEAVRRDPTHRQARVMAVRLLLHHHQARLAEQTLGPLRGSEDPQIAGFEEKIEQLLRGGARVSSR